MSTKKITRKIFNDIYFLRQLNFSIISESPSMYFQDKLYILNDHGQQYFRASMTKTEKKIEEMN